jgi:hypothetical protein
MSKPSLIADVRSILRRSLPETDEQVYVALGEAPRQVGEGNEIPFPVHPNSTVLNHAHDVMQSLRAATVLGHLFPGVPLVLVAVSEPTNQPQPTTEPLPMRTIITRRVRSGDLAAIIRDAMVEEFPANVPAQAEALLAELGAIERQDRGYHFTDEHTDDAIAAYNYRQRRRGDILAELLELKRGARGNY